MNGITTDHYRLEPPPQAPFDTLAGEVWLTRDAHVIVRYRVRATRRELAFEWSYDLSEVDALASVTLPEACPVP